MTATRPTDTLFDPPGGCGPAWERSGARPEEGQALIDERSLSKLRWRCRRGLLENDLFIERFFARHAATLNQDHARGLLALMDLADNDLLDLLLKRREPSGELERDDVVQVLRMLRAPA
ncbi:MAG: succinate dehydrogenase assembly factor 2 [Rhizobiales bacterium]|nr:succinate dehydrogenase assembly factor 2 [Rhizobacter sp.]